MGFKEIEIGFPAASQIEFDFLRQLVDRKMIPDDVVVQVLTQCREELIDRTFEAIEGCKQAIVHIYNSTSTLQRDVVFGMEREQIKEIAIAGTKMVKERAKNFPGKIILEYSPESFSNTEIDYAIEVCDAVMKEWGATKENKVILNLPTTIECSLPNQFADQIEYFCQNIPNRESCIISLHNHNDRGESVAQCELGLLAGAERVEGCLFGNGERTGNLDIINVALNMYTQGVNPELDFSELDFISKEYTRLTKMFVHPRTPYAGELVFTAFSGSHQDAIRKGMAARAKMPENAYWDVPYLPIDPHDIGRCYEGIIRFNSQSGKGGAAYILEEEYGICAPKAMHPIIGHVIKDYADSLQRELKPQELYDVFTKKWLLSKNPLNVIEISESHIGGERGMDSTGSVKATAIIEWNGKQQKISAQGNGPLDAFVTAMKQTDAPKFNITSFHEHSIGKGSDTIAMAYVLLTKEDGSQVWGVGKHSNVGRAGIAAVVSALNFV
jgi:2-isopropylmalate synthase